ncbi:unnamed protein product [Protopolystoma xenopodis]|uniref:Uncharacterized protein n=1 Tax=Protopolystoma xenopodis TaxID=117903 RepID=A0A448XG35_9PLAT|nr:unnamed protein product [Protopolystoma xenopodis]
MFPAGPSVKQQLAPTRQHCSTTPCCGTVGTSIVTQLPASVTTANSLLPCPEPFHIEARTWHSSSTISGKLPGSARPVATDGSHQVDPMDFE